MFDKKCGSGNCLLKSVLFSKQVICNIRAIFSSSIEIINQSGSLEPVCCKKRQKNQTKKLVWGIGDL